MTTNDYGKICEYPCYSLYSKYFTNINTSLLKNTCDNYPILNGEYCIWSKNISRTDDIIKIISFSNYGRVYVIRYNGFSFDFSPHKIYEKYTKLPHMMLNKKPILLTNHMIDIIQYMDIHDVFNLLEKINQYMSPIITDLYKLKMSDDLEEYPIMKSIYNGKNLYLTNYGNVYSFYNFNGDIIYLGSSYPLQQVQLKNILMICEFVNGNLLGTPLIDYYCKQDNKQIIVEDFHEILSNNNITMQNSKNYKNSKVLNNIYILLFVFLIFMCYKLILL